MKSSILSQQPALTKITVYLLALDFPFPHETTPICVKPKMEVGEVFPPLLCCCKEQTLLPSDKRQMFHSNAAFSHIGNGNEFVCTSLPSSQCQPPGFVKPQASLTKLNLMLHPPMEWCINQALDLHGVQ